MNDRVPFILRHDRVTAAVVLCAVFALLVWPVVISGRGGTNEAFDQNRFHLPVIKTMAEQWPNVDLVNYKSATTPGYHLTLAMVANVASSNEVLLQFTSSLFSLAMILVVWRWAACRIGSWPALAIVSPLMFSQYFLGSAIWITTDNAALLFVVLALAVCVRSVLTPARAAGGAVWAILAVLVRQLHLWVTAPLAIAMVLRTPVGCVAPSVLRVESSERWSWRKTIVPVALLVLPFVVVAVFVWMWGGLTPSGFDDQHGAGPNPATPAVILGLAGAFGVFFVPFFGGAGVERRLLIYCLIGAAVAMAIASISPTTHDRDAGRWGAAIWDLAQRTPVVGDRSIAITVLAGLGGFMLVRAWQACRKAGRAREATIIMFAFFTWSLAQSMNAQAWQRYCEPIILILLAWLAALATTSAPVRRAWIGPLILAALQIGIAAMQLYGDVLRFKIAPG